MTSLQQSFSVPFTYTVSFTNGLFDRANPLFRTFLHQQQEAHGALKKILVVVDLGVLNHHPNLPADIRTYLSTEPGVRLVADPLVVPGGEAAKNDPALVDRIVDAVSEYGIDRHSYVVGIGGGAVLDLVGYAAAISHRGVRHIRIPTTVLAQNDSGVGVKNGINYRGKKNFLGTFAPPVAVFNDAHFLSTLDDRDWRAGIAEAIKVALIKDLPFFEWLEAHTDALAQRNKEVMTSLIYRCADLHMQHISGRSEGRTPADAGDPFEMGSARPLDFGHWAAHKLEYLTNFSIRHGEAVAIGIALDVVYSQLAGRIQEVDTTRILHLLRGVGFELFHPALAENNSEHLVRGLAEFQEHLGGELTITLLDGLGKGVEVHEMEAELIRGAVEILEGKVIERLTV